MTNPENTFADAAREILDRWLSIDEIDHPITGPGKVIVGRGDCVEMLVALHEETMPRLRRVGFGCTAGGEWSFCTNPDDTPIYIIEESQDKEGEAK